MLFFGPLYTREKRNSEGRNLERSNCAHIFFLNIWELSEFKCKSTFGICRDHRLWSWFLLSAVWARRTPTPGRHSKSLWFCSLPKGTKVFTLQRFCCFKDCGLNKNVVADSWFTLTAAVSAPLLCSQFKLGPKWQLWSRRAIAMFPQR